jgi:hypothetical protein
VFSQKGLCPGESLALRDDTHTLLNYLQPPDDGTQADDGTDIIDSPTYTLYVTAHKSYVSHGSSFLGQSPWAILDNFVGYPDAEHSAPQWTRWAKSTACFTHKTAAFVKIFRELASWKVNFEQVSRHILF